MGAACLGCRQHELPDARETKDSSLFCAGCRALHAFLAMPVYPPWVRVLPGDAALVPVPEPWGCGDVICFMLTC